MTSFLSSLDIDRDAAARLGIEVSAITDALYDAFGQRQISTIFTQASQYRVILEVKPEFQRGISGLSNIYVLSNPPGGDGPLRSSPG